MSRYTGEEQAEQILNAASEWRQRCMINGNSLFSNKNFWNSQYLAEIESNVVNSQLELEGNFMLRLKEQLAGVSPEAKQLTAEMLWLLYLCASNISIKTKREQIKTIWDLSGELLNADHAMLQSTVLSGIGSAGTGFNTFRAREFAYFTNVLKALLALPSAEREARLSDGFSFGEWLSAIPENASRQFRHMLMFLLFPDEFERVFSNNDRRTIIRVFKPHQKEELSELLMHFDGISDVPITLQSFKLLKSDRINQRFQPVLEQCRLFIAAIKPDVLAGSTPLFSLLFDMNRLFEAWVAEKLKPWAHQQGWILRTQGPRKYLAMREGDSPQFQLRPDIALVDDKGVPQLIADTKWKLLNEADRKLGVSSSDIYQLYAYAGCYEVPHLQLIYPNQAGLRPNYGYTLQGMHAPKLAVKTVAIEKNQTLNWS